MKLYLTPENSDIYTIPVTGKYRRKGLKAFVQKNLLSLHPGFDDDTEFDFIRKHEVITAVVADSLWLTEQRLRKQNIFFILTVDGKKFHVFKKRRQLLFLIPFVLLLLMALVVVFANRAINDNHQPVPIIVQEESQQLPTVIDSISLLCRMASRIIESNGELSAITYNCGANQELIFSVGQISPQVVVNVLNDTVHIDAVSYVKNKPFFTASVIDVQNLLYPAQIPVHQIHAEIESVLGNIPGISLLSAQLNGNGSVSFDLTLTGKSLVPFVSAVSDLSNNHLFFTNASFINGGNGILNVSLTAISLDTCQIISNDNSALSKLPQLFNLTVPVTAKPTEITIPDIKETQIPHGAVKIGETVHGSIRTIYIRLADGKIETHTEKVD